MRREIVRSVFCGAIIYLVMAVCSAVAGSGGKASGAGTTAATTPGRPGQLQGPGGGPCPAPANSAKLWMDVKDYGAKGDGKTDDTAAINCAITAASSVPGTSGTVFFPLGTYKITSAIVSEYGVNFHGDGGSYLRPGGAWGRRMSTLLWGGAKGETMMRLQGIGTHVVVENLYFDGHETAGIGLDLEAVAGGNFDRQQVRNCGISNCDVGLSIDMYDNASHYACGSTISDVTFLNNIKAAEIGNHNAYSIDFRDSEFLSGRGTHHLLNHGGKVYFNNCYFGPVGQYQGGSKPDKPLYSIVEIDGPGTVSMDQCYSEAHYAYVLKASQLMLQSGAPNVNIVNSWFPMSQAANHVMIQLDSTVTPPSGGSIRMNILGSFINGRINIDAPAYRVSGSIIGGDVVDGVTGDGQSGILIQKPSQVTDGSTGVGEYLPSVGNNTGRVALSGTAPALYFGPLAPDPNNGKNQPLQTTDVLKLAGLKGGVLQFSTPNASNGLKMDFAKYGVLWTTASSMPSSGKFNAGDVVWNNSISPKNTTLCWVRLTTGSSHVPGADWLAK